MKESHLIAYDLGSLPYLRLVPATRGRAWMDATREHFAKRCLPLLLANQAGWVMLNNATLTATWNGGLAPEDLTISALDNSEPIAAVSHFGHGLLTWHLPYLFRTSPGYNLLVRGPANWPKDGASPLEGLVETDWTCATFTMNWQITRPHTPITFSKDEPICMLVPQRRGELEAFAPHVTSIHAEPEMQQAYASWSAERSRFLAELTVPGSDACRQGWQKDYFQGRTEEDGTSKEGHQLKLQVRPFEHEKKEGM